jgi:hypothetical protein
VGRVLSAISAGSRTAAAGGGLGGAIIGAFEAICLARDRDCWRRLIRQPMVLAVQQHAAEPFRETHWHWTAVLTLQRLVTVMFRALTTERVVASLGVTMVSFFLVVLQLLAHPYRLKRTNRLKLTAAVCLTLLSMPNLIQRAFSSAGSDAEQTSSQVGLRCLDGVMLALIFPTPLLFLHGFVQDHDGELEDVVVTKSMAE